MYTVYINDLLIHDQSSPDKDIHLIDPVLNLTENAAGSFSFTIPPDHIGYGEIDLMSDTIIVKKEGKVIWTGRPVTRNGDFWNRQKYTCEGALAFLNDTLLPAKEYSSISNREMFRTVIEEHNKKARSNREFGTGTITVQDMDDPFSYVTNFEKTWDFIKSNFIDRLGGHINVTYNTNDTNDPPKPIINYYGSYITSNQSINFGENLLDFTNNWDLSNMVTVVYPRGAEITDEDNNSI